MRKIDELDVFVDYLEGKRKSEYVNERQAKIAKIVKAINEPTQKKKENWKRYCNWCKKHKIPDTEENREKFKDSDIFIKDIDFKKMNGILRRYTPNQIEMIHQEALQAKKYPAYFLWKIKQINAERKSRRLHRKSS